MAGLQSDSKGWKITFYDSAKDRKTIRLGQQATAEYARRIKRLAEELLLSQIEQRPLDQQWAKRVAKLPDAMHAKLATVGLVVPRQKQLQALLKPFLDDYIARRDDVKPATRVIWQSCKNDLIAHFGEGCKLLDIGPVEAENFRLYLVRRKLAPSTIAKRLQRARQFMAFAKKQKLIKRNPFDEVRHHSGDPRHKQRFIDEATTKRLLDVASPDWRTIIGLARYGGLRCPSEVLSLKWVHIDWANNRVRVPSPKTSNYGKAERAIPLFPRLRAILLDAQELAPKGAEYVVDPKYRAAADHPNGWNNCNLRTTFEKIIKRAGVTQWPRLFHNLRSSLETELAAEYPIQTVADWMGHSAKIALAHYCQTRETDFDKAAGIVETPKVAPNETENAESPNETTEKVYPKVAPPVTELPCISVQGYTIDVKKPRENRVSRGLVTTELAGTGFEPATSRL